MHSRSIIIIILTILATRIEHPALANVINAEQVRGLAETFIKFRTQNSSNLYLKQAAIQIEIIKPINDPLNNTHLGYCITLKPSGYIISSAYSENDPIIAYSFDQSWNPANSNIRLA